MREEFQAFLYRLSNLNLRLELFNVDATTLPRLLVPLSYDKIEVSNISDAGYVGTRRVLSLFAPLLQATAENADATIITCYLNAVMEMVKMTGTDTIPDIDFLAQYLPGSLDIVEVLRQGAHSYSGVTKKKSKSKKLLFSNVYNLITRKAILKRVNAF